MTGMLEDEEIRRIMTDKTDVRERALRLVEAANDQGGSDNIAVIVIEPFLEEVSR